MARRGCLIHVTPTTPPERASWKQVQHTTSYWDVHPADEPPVCFFKRVCGADAVHLSAAGGVRPEPGHEAAVRRELLRSLSLS